MVKFCQQNLFCTFNSEEDNYGTMYAMRTAAVNRATEFFAKQISNTGEEKHTAKKNGFEHSNHQFKKTAAVKRL